MKLDNVFACERVRRFEETNERLIECLTVERINDRTQRHVIRFGFIARIIAGHAPQNGERIRTADADYSDPSTARRRG
jgi:hypothetical protein